MIWSIGNHFLLTLVWRWSKDQKGTLSEKPKFSGNNHAFDACLDDIQFKQVKAKNILTCVCHYRHDRVRDTAGHRHTQVQEDLISYVCRRPCRSHRTVLRHIHNIPLQFTVSAQDGINRSGDGITALSWAVPSYQVARNMTLARDKRWKCCTWFVHDCAIAYVRETVRGAVRRL